MNLPNCNSHIASIFDICRERSSSSPHMEKRCCVNNIGALTLTALNTSHTSQHHYQVYSYHDCFLYL